MTKRLNIPSRKEVIITARLWKRILAFLADLVIIDFLVSPLSSLVSGAMPSQDFSAMQDYFTANPEMSNVMLVLALSIGFVALVYFSVMEYKLGQTIGKMIFGLYVQPLDKNPRFFQYLIRSLLVIPVVPFIFFLIIDPVYLIYNKEQRLLERWSGTKTIEKIAI